MAGFRRNHRLVCVGTPGWNVSEYAIKVSDFRFLCFDICDWRGLEEAVTSAAFLIGTDPDIIGLIEHAEGMTRDNTRITLTIALSYGGRAEIVSAVRVIAQRVQSGDLAPATIDADCFAHHLFTAGLPDPDLLIRTSGEQRISNFLLWQSAYSEFVFTKTLWPDFSKRDLEKAIDEFCGRERRYGASVGPC